MSTKLTIVEGNSNDKDNVRAIMVKGEKGDKGDNGEITYSDVVDNLTSTETQKPLSANQGKQLKELNDITNEFINSSIFIDNITTEEVYDDSSSTTYYITEIPYQDENGNQNKWKLGVGNDNTETLNSLESTIEFAKRNNASICINGGLFHLSDETNIPYGVLIKDGIVLQNTISSFEGSYILGIKEDGSFSIFDATTTNAQQVLNAGCTNALVGYKAIIQNGSDVSDSSTTLKPRQVIARKTNGDYLIFTCDGRTKYDLGMTISDVQRILTTYNVDFAFELDDGGSTSTVVEFQKINKNIDNQYTDRPVQNFLYMAKNITKEDLSDIYKKLSDLKQKIVKEFVTFHDLWYGYLKLYAPDENPGIEFYQDSETEVRSGKILLNNEGFYVRQKEEESEERNLMSVLNDYLYYKGIPFGNFANYCTNTASATDLNNIDVAGFYLCTSSTTNTPQTGNNFIILHINNNSSLTNETQYAFPMNNTSFIYCRRKIDGGSWGNWAPISVYACSTANRPTGNLATGTQIWDYNLHKPLWYQNGNWYDATGTQV